MRKLQLRDQPSCYVKLLSATVTLGRDESNAMVIDDPSVSDFHAEIGLDDEQLYIVDLLSANGTFINGQRVGARCELQSWDVIQLGNVELEINDPNKYRPDEWALRAESDLLARQFYVLSGNTIVGRGSECDLIIESELLSRRHAEMTIDNDRLHVVDLGSANGTFLNGIKIEEAYAVPGDELRFDLQSFIVVGPSPPASRGAVLEDYTELRASTGDETVVAVPEDPDATQIMIAEDFATEFLSVAPPQAFLIEQAGLLPEPRILLSGSCCQIGRAQGNDVVLPDGSVSKKHTQLELRQGHWSIKDTGSSNGVLVNDELVDSAVLQNGDVIALGRLTFVFECDQQAAAVDPVPLTMVQEAKESKSKAALPRAKRGMSTKGVSPWLPGLLIFLAAVVAAVVLYAWRTGLIP